MIKLKNEGPHWHSTLTFSHRFVSYIVSGGMRDIKRSGKPSEMFRYLKVY